MKKGTESAFLTLTERTVNECYRNPLNFVSYVILLLATLAISVLDFTRGAIFLTPAVLLLVLSTVNCFAKSTKRKASTLKTLTAISCILLALYFGFEAFSIYTDYKLPIILTNFSQNLTSPFNSFVNQGVSNLKIAVAGTMLSFVGVIWLNNTLTQSVKKNVIITSPLGFCLVLQLLLCVVFSCLAIYELNLLSLNLDAFKTILGITTLKIISTGIYLFLLIFCILQAIRSLVIYKKLRKVKNAF